MSAVPQSLVDQVVTTRALSMATRLACGAGRTSITAYRDDPDHAIDVLAHGLSATGELVLAVQTTGQAPALLHLPGYDFDVRVDIHKESFETSARIVAASLHLLGSMMWLTDQATDPLCARRDLPAGVDEVRSLPGVRIAVVRTDRAVLHDSMGVSPFCWDHLTDVAFQPTGSQHWDWIAEWEAHALVASLGQDDLLAIHRAVIDERLPGKLCGADLHGAGTTELTTVLCVDADPCGITLIAAGPEGTVTTFAGFAKALNTVRELPAALGALVFAAMTRR